MKMLQALSLIHDQVINMNRRENSAEGKHRFTRITVFSQNEEYSELHKTKTLQANNTCNILLYYISHFYLFPSHFILYIKSHFPLLSSYSKNIVRKVLIVKLKLLKSFLTLLIQI